MLIHDCTCTLIIIDASNHPVAIQIFLALQASPRGDREAAMDAIFAALRIVPFAAIGVSEKSPPEISRNSSEIFDIFSPTVIELHYLHCHSFQIETIVLAIEPSNKPPPEEASIGAGGSWYFARTRTHKKRSGAFDQ